MTLPILAGFMAIIWVHVNVASVCGIVSKKEGETDMVETGERGKLYIA